MGFLGSPLDFRHSWITGLTSVANASCSRDSAATRSQFFCAVASSPPSTRAALENSSCATVTVWIIASIFPLRL